MFKKYVFAMTIILALVLSACGPAATSQPPAVEPTNPPVVEPTKPPVVEPTTPPAVPAVKELTILWAQWSPADYLQQIGNLYEQETGIKVTVVQEPWGSFGDRFNVAMAAGGTEWDMVVGDSQWIGQGATAGYYVDLTDFMKANGIDKSVTPATLQYYGEYPAGSGKYYGFPTEGDADGWAYRKDLFEDPANMAAFKTEYGYDLAVPTTWAQLMDIAKFFTKADKSMNGVAIYTQKDYDAITMGFENVMFSYGAKWQNPDNTVEGVVNSQASIDALQYYRDLYDCCQAPGLNNAFYTETNDAFIGGQVAMTMNYFAFFPALANPSTNPIRQCHRFLRQSRWPDRNSQGCPRRPGFERHFLRQLGTPAGRRLISSSGSHKRDIQAQWAALGGYTCNSQCSQDRCVHECDSIQPGFFRDHDLRHGLLEHPNLRCAAYTLAELPERLCCWRRGHG